MNIHEIIHAWENNALPRDFGQLAAIQNKVDDYSLQAEIAWNGSESELVKQMYSGEMKVYEIITSDIDGIVAELGEGPGEKVSLGDFLNKEPDQNVMFFGMTQGKWEVLERDGSFAVYVQDAEYGLLYICEEICQGEDDGLADACLISAAPDLYKALYWLNEQERIGASEYVALHDAPIVVEALQKAKGQLQEEGGNHE